MSGAYNRTMPPIRFDAPLSSIGSWTILRLPKAASAKFPSRGMVMAEGTINGFQFQSPLEPDGKGSHWLRVDGALGKGARAKAGDTVTLAMEPSEEWPEPAVPADVKKALKASPKAYEVWMDTTTAARWDWLRWIASTKNPETRQKRIGVSCSKLRSGERRPCCFNRSMCCEPAVSNGGVLIGE